MTTRQWVLGFVPAPEIKPGETLELVTMPDRPMRLDRLVLSGGLVVERLWKAPDQTLTLSGKTTDHLGTDIFKLEEGIELQPNEALHARLRNTTDASMLAACAVLTLINEDFTGPVLNPTELN